MQLLLKICSGLANSVDPDQTAPSRAVRSGSALFAYKCHFVGNFGVQNFRPYTVFLTISDIYFNALVFSES